MTYRETLAYLYGLSRFGIKPGLERIRALLQALGNPQERVRFVHVAGTNGKGSTAAFLASILRAGGYRTGLFTSPHLVRFTERIRIDGAEIGEAAVISLVARTIAAAPPGATFFEIVTAIAYLHFTEQGVELAVVEVGMGGRYDATNAGDGLLAIITPVSLDHCEYLGDTLAAIAAEKAGIIRPGRPVVLGPQPGEAAAVLAEAGRSAGSPVYRGGMDFLGSWEGAGLQYRGLRRELAGLAPGIGGRYQAENAAVALAAAELLADNGFPLAEEALRAGLAAARWPGRMELFAGEPRILLDGAHNPAGATALAASLVVVPRRRLILVVGVMGDKDWPGILAPLLPLAQQLVAVEPALERACPAAELAAFAVSRGVPGVAAGSVAQGLAWARDEAGNDDLILVCGSLYTVGEARAVLTEVTFEACRG